ncbi:hypothetical protein MIMGU_mgv1a024414mg [Erythranthe guttata]|uniref:MSP domain-containing protein n=1 Tax=Erythranthe guttata TaxID=4155 RepID=A0A022RET9_ERYGU|nr:hypothetical protein MIMGU_mgv1a024414mg [Erythranthe guttata]
MDRLISLEPSNVVIIRVEPGHRCSGQLTLRNVMYTMPVAFRLQPINKTRYNVVPQSGIILPLTTVTLEITYNLPPNSTLPHRFPHCDDSFVLQSVVAPGASVKNPSTTHDSVPVEWFTHKKKQVYSDSGIRVMFVGSQILTQLVSKGSNMDEIREVLEKSDPSWKSADSTDSDGQSLLHLAISQARPDLVQLLLEFGPGLEARGRSGTSPLEAAAASGEALIVELLLAHRASPERSESSAWGPIHLAAGNGHIEVLRHLLLKGANVNAATKDGNFTALHLAQMVKLLLHRGANKDIRNKAGKTAYDLAAENGHAKLFDALRLGDSLCVAARKGELRMIVRLLDNGALINGRDQNGWTGLHRAAFKGRADVARALIEKGIDVNAKDECGYTALHCAVESGQVDVIELLVKKGADIEARTNKGVSALQIAESLHYPGIVRILVHRGGTKDGASQGKINMIGSEQNNSESLFKGIGGREIDVGAVKKAVNRGGRARRSSFERSAMLAVV